MAMTAWAAKFVTRAICLSVKGRTSWRYRVNAPTSSFSFQHRDSQNRPYTSKFDGCNEFRIASFSVVLFRRQIGDVNRRFGRYHATARSPRT